MAMMQMLIARFVLVVAVGSAPWGCQQLARHLPEADTWMCQQLLHQTSGFGTALETLIIFFVACLSLLAHTYATLACIGCFGLFLMLLVWMSLHLPYYHNFTNILLCSFYASCAFLFLGGAVGTAVNTSDVLINVWFLCTPMVAAIACFAPRIQWGRMERSVAPCNLPC